MGGTESKVIQQTINDTLVEVSNENAASCTNEMKAWQVNVPCGTQLINFQRTSQDINLTCYQTSMDRSDFNFKFLSKLSTKLNLEEEGIDLQNKDSEVYKFLENSLNYNNANEIVSTCANYMTANNINVTPCGTFQGMNIQLSSQKALQDCVQKTANFRQLSSDIISVLTASADITKQGLLANISDNLSNAFNSFMENTFGAFFGTFKWIALAVIIVIGFLIFIVIMAVLTGLLKGAFRKENISGITDLTQLGLQAAQQQQILEKNVFATELDEAISGV
jgi:hypothetical protein